jgi:hypothetical protein
VFEEVKPIPRIVDAIDKRESAHARLRLPGRCAALEKDDQHERIALERNVKF